MSDKPPYQVPTMEQIRAVPWNGYKVVSTFSGCGGSCLGFEMAGYRVLWASEFIPAAQETYRANHPNVLLDTRDIRKVTAQDILAAIGLVEGEIDVLEGSPPCASFSTAGKREKGWGKVKNYSDTKQRVDDLFFEYARLLKGLQPKVFVAENVSGLVKGTAKGYFLEILQALKKCGYRVQAKLLDAQWLGVPQMRQRIIFIGVREDLRREPVFPKPLPYRYTVREAIPWIVAQGDNGGFGAGGMRPSDQPSPTIGTGTQAGNVRYPPALVEAMNPWIDRPLPTIQAGAGARARSSWAHGTCTYEVQESTRRAYLDKRGAYGNDGDITNQPAPTILSDSVGTHWVVGLGTKDGERSLDQPAPSVLTHGRQHTTSELTVIEADTDISGYAIGKEYDRLEPGEQSERYYQLVRANAALPWDTVTQRGGDNTVASVCHPTERRKFSIAELRRICAFPDDFILTGTYAQQWERLGRAVPPVMMYYIAQTIRVGILDTLDKGED